MFEIIAIIIFLVGFIGMGFIILRKIPVLAELSAQKVEGPGVFDKLREKIKSSEKLRAFSKEVLLQKIVSKAKDLTLKTENKLRQKAREKKNKFSDDFWEKIKREK